MSKVQVLAVILVVLIAAALFADQIVLKNGDRLTGKIEKFDGKTLVIRQSSPMRLRCSGRRSRKSTPPSLCT